MSVYCYHLKLLKVQQHLLTNIVLFTGQADTKKSPSGENEREVIGT